MATYLKKAGDDLKVDLNISYGTKTLSKSITKTFSEEIVQRKEVDATDAGVQVLAFNDASFLASSLKNAKGLVICNEGGVSAELNFNVAEWTHAAPDTNNSAGGSDLKRVLNAGEFLYFPNLSLIEHTAGNSAALGDADALDNTAPPTAMYVDSGVNLNTALENSEDHLSVADIAPFEVGDYVQVGINDTTETRIEVMEITSITDDSGTDQDAAGTLVVSRALFGTSLADKDTQTDGTNGAVSSANVHFPIFNAYYDYNNALSGSSQLIMTDGKGRYKINNFWGYARSAVANDEGQGIVAGSVALKFYNSAYAEVHFPRPITASTDSSISASTAYEFDLTLDDSSATAIVFTTSSNTKFGGSDGVIRKMQDSIDTAFEGTAYGCTVAIVNGALRFTSKSHMAAHDGTNGSKVLIEDRSGSTGADLFTGSVGIMPNDTAFPAAVVPTLPDDVIIDISSGRSTPNVDAFMYDDGHGNLIYQGNVVGTVSYLTGAMDWTIPSLPYAQFVLNGHYASAFSGGVKILAGHADTGISSIHARSVNSKINTTIGVYAFN
tara:strand:+ start:160 stop:1815 length:1656 start_codon:yes stop_codon:yes gene_type:complete